uniref:R3 protein n=1 Tax=Toxoplasma gondii TaxID=5811 RepID=Q8I7P2_TOXGO|nr:R3 protein [Toxoplasma gondii]
MPAIFVGGSLPCGAKREISSDFPERCHNYTICAAMACRNLRIKRIQCLD